MKNISYSAWLFISFLILMSATLAPGCKEDGEKTGRVHKSKLRGTITISGAFALYPMTVKWAEEFQKLHPKVRIDVSAGGAGKGMTDALSGMVDLGMISRGITQAEIDKGAWFIAVAKDAVVPTINSKNPYLEIILKHGITKQKFQDIFLTQVISDWNLYDDENLQATRMNVFTRSDACGAAQMWGEFLGKNQESLNGVGVFGDPGMADAIKNDMYAIGYNNINYVYDMTTRGKREGLEIIPVDLNENGTIDPDENFYSTLDAMITAIKDNKYPSPPARDLYFVSQGKPKNAVVVAFIKWILTDGQNFVNESGYVRLSEEKIGNELTKL
ncbi:MAG: PstS family phosphate ABC transporter substrate-binding protein [Bacteroidetes bacterium]|nr:PstS family phosphate ABC transporter substrate-binding protein [Bacteroidota bacterium]